MPVRNNLNIVSPNVPIAGSSERNRVFQRYQLSWNPSFYAKNSSVYVLGEDIKFLSSGRELRTPSQTHPAVANLQQLIDLGATNGLIIPLNSNIALAQEYSPEIKNKVVTYETVGGNSITTFGEAIKIIGLRIRIIRLSDMWQIYYKGLEALSYLSANQGRYYGGLYLTGYDSFDDNRRQSSVSYRYKVTISRLNFNFKSDQNTSVLADLQMFVNQDLTRSRKEWGQL